MYFMCFIPLDSMLCDIVDFVIFVYNSVINIKIV